MLAVYEEGIYIYIYIYPTHELQTRFPYGLTDRVADEFETDNAHITVATKFSFFPRNSYANLRKIAKAFPVFYHNTFYTIYIIC